MMNVNTSTGSCQQKVVNHRTRRWMSQEGGFSCLQKPDRMGDTGFKWRIVFDKKTREQYRKQTEK